MLEKLNGPARAQLAEAGVASSVVTSMVARYVDAALEGNPRRLELVGEVFKAGERMRRATDDTAATVEATIADQMHQLKNELWATALAGSGDSTQSGGTEARRCGHLRDFTVAGEPDLPPGFRYEPTPLLLPGVQIDVDFAKQGRLGNCYLISAINAVAQWDPDAFTDMVKPDPDDENFVIVTVHGGTYRLPATLPVDAQTGREVFSTSPDGSTVVPYLEKAAAAHLGSWNDLAGGNPIYPLWWLVGDRYGHFNSFFVNDMPDADVRAVMTADKPSCVAVPAGGADEGRVSVLSKLNLVEGHGYTVRKGLLPTGHKLHNPWLRLHPNPLEPHDLRALGAVLIWAGDKEYKPPVQPATEGLNT